MGDKVPGCDRDRCEEADGYTKTLLDAWYMSCITVTTIGFGDFSPKSRSGRIFALFWMLTGVTLLGRFSYFFSKSFIEAGRMSEKLTIDVNAIFNKIDRNGNGVLNRYEFLVFALMEYGFMEEEDLEAINDQFDAFDKDHNGRVTKEEVLLRYASLWEAEAEFATKSTTRKVAAFFGLGPEIG